MRKLVLAIACTALATAAHADGNLSITDAWSRATPSADGSAVVYFTVTDSGADQLTGASTPIAARAELHDTTMEGGVTRMRQVTQPITVDANHPFKASPNGYHLMLTGLKEKLKVGSSFPMTLTFANAGAVTATVRVQPVTTVEPAMNMDGMDMSH